MRIPFNLFLGIVISLVITQGKTVTALNNSHSAVLVTSSQGRNSISGFVFGDSRTPLADTYVQLLDELGTTISQVRTTGSGRYAFYGLSSGRFKVRVFPVGTDYMEQIQEVIIAPVSAIPGSGADNQQIDFYLRLRAGANAGPFGVPGTIFAQEVPDEAKKLFEQGVSELRQKKEKEGFENLKRAASRIPPTVKQLGSSSRRRSK
jgi:uncharacterized protein DUF1416